ncbi:hypothetical protein [Pseudomonas phage Njord]|uniref:N-acetyltransferase domain-containing protein n=1 Tax=Pseudomonas phage Njord TaxID=2163985 RepID=A0A2S1GMI9_9CAUD|nr:hypothetical protein HOT08_gp01 [Pseudomonas phage Njord]AWD90589.1 hypothetical protein [Pseudomonas phage Njord]
MAFRNILKLNRYIIMASVIIKQTDITKFYYGLGLAKRMHPKGDSLSSADEVVNEVAQAFQSFASRYPNTPHKSIQAMFYRDHCKVYLAKDQNALTGGFLILDGELKGLFSLKQGIGSWLVGWAVKEGAKRLDCFDGYLTGFYKRAGFTEVRRVENWAHGGPQVVYMEI